tara:strand:+ start:1396 stop:2376 length:981 start_codon:yes stop_codon:yes gene_type:complete
MRIAETKLRQIVLEEVQLRLLELYIAEELDRMFEEDEEDDDVAAWKKSKKGDWTSTIKKAAIPALALGLGAGGLKYATDDHADTRAAATDAQIAQNVAASETDEAQLQKFAKQLNNQYAFRWGKGDDSVVYAPGSKGKITVLPPSYSIAVKALQDKKINADRIEQGLRPIERYGEIDLDNLRDDDRTYSGDYEQNIDSFFKTHKGNFVNAFDVVGDHDELKVVPGSGSEQMIVMVDPNKISGDYYLPELGMTAADYYNSQYGEFMGSGELEALEKPDEEMTVTPDDDKEMLDQGIIDATNKRAQKHSMKENKITWKNYRNRKKMLA